MAICSQLMLSVLLLLLFATGTFTSKPTSVLPATHGAVDTLNHAYLDLHNLKDHIHDLVELRGRFFNAWNGEVRRNGPKTIFLPNLEDLHDDDTVHREIVSIGEALRTLGHGHNSIASDACRISYKQAFDLSMFLRTFNNQGLYDEVQASNFLLVEAKTMLECLSALHSAHRHLWFDYVAALETTKHSLEVLDSILEVRRKGIWFECANRSVKECFILQLHKNFKSLSFPFNLVRLKEMLVRWRFYDAFAAAVVRPSAKDRIALWDVSSMSSTEVSLLHGYLDITDVSYAIAQVPEEDVVQHLSHLLDTRPTKWASLAWLPLVP